MNKKVKTCLEYYIYIYSIFRGNSGNSGNKTKNHVLWRNSARRRRGRWSSSDKNVIVRFCQIWRKILPVFLGNPSPPFWGICTHKWGQHPRICHQKLWQPSPLACRRRNQTFVIDSNSKTYWIFQTCRHNAWSCWQGEHFKHLGRLKINNVVNFAKTLSYTHEIVGRASNSTICDEFKFPDVWKFPKRSATRIKLLAGRALLSFALNPKVKLIAHLRIAQCKPKCRIDTAYSKTV